MKSEEFGEIKEGALFVADAHYPHHGEEFLELLRRLQNGEIVTPQLFLMGDIFDLLFGQNEYIKTFYPEAISILNELSKSIEIHYFEGNHDFLLKNIFTNIKVYPRESQPVLFKLNGKVAGLSHGDRFALGWKYDLYCLFQRSPLLFTVLKPFGKYLIDRQMGKLKKKSICRKMPDFEKRAEKILAHYNDANIVIEGHYHQGVKLGRYISLPALACQKEITVVRNGELLFLKLESL